MCIMSAFQNPPGKSNGLLQPIPLISEKPLQRLTFYYLDPLPTSNGKKYINLQRNKNGLCKSNVTCISV